MQPSTYSLAALALISTAVPASSQTPARHAPAAAPVPGLELVSRSSAGVQGNSWSGGAALSAGGRFVAFHSISDNLVAGDTNNHYDIFVHDRLADVTERVSVDSSGLQADASSVYPSMSADGRLVAFASYATDLVPGDGNGTWDVFVHDRVTGETRLVSRSSAGVQGNGKSEDAAISADGRFVAFRSFASNLAPDPNGSLVMDVFVHDLPSGETTLASLGHQGEAANQNCDAPAMSADGRFVVFHSGSTNLVAGDTNGLTDIFLRDRLAGTTVRVNLDSAGMQADHYSFHPALSGDGRFVAFQSAAALVSGDDDGGFFDVYVHDVATGETLGITTGIPALALSAASRPSLSGDGSRIAFLALEIEPLFEGTSQAFLHDRASGATVLLSQGIGRAGDADSALPALSADGRVVGFESLATNLVAGDTNGAADMFVRAAGGF
jgi:Tol biopolymer transport system component